jgi:D-glycero-D-manno-heptose 1,7-bisphosphate phosphatase
MAAFLDRDGVITKNVRYERWGETEAPMCPEDIKLIPDAVSALTALQDARYELFIVSNQGAYAKGKTTLESLIGTARHVDELLRGSGVRIRESYYSFTHPDGMVEGFSGPSAERKPSPYFLRIAAAAYGIDLSMSWMIGDRDTDVMCGRSAGCRTARILEPGEEIACARCKPDITAHSLHEAAAVILGITS